MAIIKYPNPKSIELLDLESHVRLEEQRRLLIESRIDRLEEKYRLWEDREHNGRKLTIGNIVSVVTALATTLIAVAVTMFGK